MGISIDRSRLIGHLKRLVEFETVASREDEIVNCISYIESQLRDLGLFVHHYKVPQAGNDGHVVHSSIWNTSENKHPTVLLYAHIDVVAADPVQFRVSIQNSVAHGRGVFDMKFAVAIYLEVLQACTIAHIELPNLALMIVSDEEVGGEHGARYLLANEKFRPEVVIMPDGGPNWHIVRKAKGLLHVTLETIGKTAHASRPWDGTNAIDQIIQIASDIRENYVGTKSPQLATTVTITHILGGESTSRNQVPDTASLYLDIRFPPEEEAENILKRLYKIGTAHSQNFHLKPIVKKSAFKVDESNQYVQLWAELIRGKSEDELFIEEAGTADHHYFSEYGIPVIVSQPKGGGIHSDSEWIDLDQMVEYASVLAQFLSRITKLKGK